MICLIRGADNVLLILCLFCNHHLHVSLFSPSTFFLLSFELVICFQLLEALEDDYRPNSSSTSTSTIRVTGRGNDVNRLTEGQNNPPNDNNAMQPKTNGSDGNNLSLVR